MSSTVPALLPSPVTTVAPRASSACSRAIKMEPPCIDAGMDISLGSAALPGRLELELQGTHAPAPKSPQTYAERHTSWVPMHRVENCDDRGAHRYRGGEARWGSRDDHQIVGE